MKFYAKIFTTQVHASGVYVVSKVLNEAEAKNEPTMEDFVETDYTSRMNFATVGGTYDKNLDVFYSAQPYPSWTLNTTTYTWEAPIARPTNAAYTYKWNELEQVWDAI